MTVEEEWNLYQEWVAPEKRGVARVAFFAGYVTALDNDGRHKEASAVMDALLEGKP